MIKILKINIYRFLSNFLWRFKWFKSLVPDGTDIIFTVKQYIHVGDVVTSNGQKWVIDDIFQIKIEDVFIFDLYRSQYQFHKLKKHYEPLLSKIIENTIDNQIISIETGEIVRT